MIHVHHMMMVIQNLGVKMVVLDIDHPEIVDFIRWKVREEKKVAALVAARNNFV